MADHHHVIPFPDESVARALAAVNGCGVHDCPTCLTAALRAALADLVDAQQRLAEHELMAARLRAAARNLADA